MEITLKVSQPHAQLNSFTLVQCLHQLFYIRIMNERKRIIRRGIKRMNDIQVNMFHISSFWSFAMFPSENTRYKCLVNHAISHYESTLGIL